MTSQPRLILASASPRRLEILRAHGHLPEVYPSDTDEQLDANLSLGSLPDALESLALAKADSVTRRLLAESVIANDETAFVVAADTVVYADQVIGKPADRAQAIATLTLLSGRMHQVLTAVAVIRLPDGDVLLFTDTAEVSFAEYGLDEITAFIDAEPPYDKAGSYAIQGIWGTQVTKISGDRETVIGLPYRRLAVALGLFG
ncbi:MAG: Maf family protein [Coriobacteriales bacterium]|nr:Maf family protein [Coriobacteriales bacterium]